MSGFRKASKLLLLFYKQPVSWQRRYCCFVWSLSRVQLFCDPVDSSLARLLCPWNFPGKNTGEGCHFLLQGIFLTQGLAGGFFTTEPPGEPKRFFYTRAFSYVQPLTLKVKVPYSTWKQNFKHNTSIYSRGCTQTSLNFHIHNFCYQHFIDFF